jgi:hypothetical protein
MRFEPGRPFDEVLDSLHGAAEHRWGTARLPELESALDSTGRATWRLAQVPLDPLDEEPDFVGDAGAGPAEARA